MQNEQEKKKGNKEECLRALVREHVMEFEQQRAEKVAARLQESQQQNEGEKQGAFEDCQAESIRTELESQKRSQREFKGIAETVDKLKKDFETQVTVVLEEYWPSAVIQ
jgi:hypothetical protein